MDLQFMYHEMELNKQVPRAMYHCSSSSAGSRIWRLIFTAFTMIGHVEGRAGRHMRVRDFASNTAKNTV